MRSITIIAFFTICIYGAVASQEVSEKNSNSTILVEVHINGKLAAIGVLVNANIIITIGDILDGVPLLNIKIKVNGVFVPVKKVEYHPKYNRLTGKYNLAALVLNVSVNINAKLVVGVYASGTLKALVIADLGGIIEVVLNLLASILSALVCVLDNLQIGVTAGAKLALGSPILNENNVMVGIVAKVGLNIGGQTYCALKFDKDACDWIDACSKKYA